MQQWIKQRVPLFLITMTVATIGLCLGRSEVRAQEAWVEVTTNAVGDRFLVNQNSIERSQDTVRYWEYRQFQQPNNAFLDVEVEQPVYGVMIYRSVDCTSGAERTRRLVIFDQDRQVIQRINYDDNGSLTQPAPGSSAAQVVRHVCTAQS
ncbi:surface-adhesin E family protein [Leptolyngbya ohadii]|uniref:surface-adhesin E family protein n=1 Tax=Leptolyngbya ohadii TaxID=1962290 RepID=UPI000B599F62|nr:surface-adhesin E family protein [Leptolyngbya ohadii]